MVTISAYLVTWHYLFTTKIRIITATHFTRKQNIRYCFDPHYWAISCKSQFFHCLCFLQPNIYACLTNLSRQLGMVSLTFGSCKRQINKTTYIQIWCTCCSYVINTFAHHFRLRHLSVYCWLWQVLGIVNTILYLLSLIQLNYSVLDFRFIKYFLDKQ